MIRKNIVRNIKILISTSFIKSMQNEFLKNRNLNISLKDIQNEIKELLIYEKKIDKQALINFEEIADKFQGIIIENKSEIICFTQILNNQNKIKSRNTFLSQNISPIYRMLDKYKIKVKSISLNPFNIDEKLKIPDFIKNSFRQLITDNFKLNNSVNKLDNFKKFYTLDEFIETIFKIREKNSGNLSTIIQKNPDHSITIYGRLDGANFSDTIQKCRIIRKLSNEDMKIFFYDISPNFSHSRINATKKEFTKLNIEIGPRKIDRNNLKRQNNELLTRDQDLFRSNIIKKYIKSNIDITKCFASKYEITQNLIASHIHRVVDIKNEYHDRKIDYEKAKHLLVSGDNGFLLSPNKDKEFENGQIYFDTKLKKFIPNKSLLTNEQYESLSKTLEMQLDFSKMKETKEFIENNIKHQKRNGIIKN